MKNYKIILTSKPNFAFYSIEAGNADRKCHFDHHGNMASNPSPCTDNAIKPITEDDSIIEITHMDADTFVGILRLVEKQLPDVDLKLMEQIDNNGSSICSDKFNPTLLYMVGLGTIVRKFNFPRVSEERQDVTSLVEKIFVYSTEDIIKVGKTTQKKAEQSYKNCLVKKINNKALFIIDENDALDPSRAYEDKIDIVIVYRKHYKTVSIYCNPKSNYSFGGKTVAGIQFAGHPQASGSPRGKEMSQQQAVDVFKEIY